MSAAAAATDRAALQAALRQPHSSNNITPAIIDKVGMGLHLNRDHPLGQLKHRISSYFDESTHFKTFDQLSPIVTKQQNFDDLLIPDDHVSRRATDTYYLDDNRLLRCHMTAHQTELLRAGESAFLMIGDVYRRDEIDATHYPVFHQVDGVRVWRPDELPASVRGDAAATSAFVMADLQSTLEGMVKRIFGEVSHRWVDAYFPFTDPSLEAEIHFDGKWLEVLGSGAIRAQILTNCGFGDRVGWAFGMGLERLAMVLHDIPDIRLFWTTDQRFTSQFAGAGAAAEGGGARVKFKPYSKLPPCYKDVAFWLPATGFHENDLFELVRGVAGDIVESVARVDAFTHPKTKRESHCYRIMYRHMDRTLTNAEVDELQFNLRDRLPKELGVELR